MWKQEEWSGENFKVRKISTVKRYHKIHQHVGWSLRDEVGRCVRLPFAQCGCVQTVGEESLSLVTSESVVGKLLENCPHRLSVTSTLLRSCHHLQEEKNCTGTSFVQWLCLFTILVSFRLVRGQEELKCFPGVRGLKRFEWLKHR